MGGGGRGGSVVVAGFKVLVGLGIAPPKALASMREGVSILERSKKTGRLDRPLHITCSKSRSIGHVG